MPLATFTDLCIDAVDARRLGTFWAAALGLDVEPLDRGMVKLVGPTPHHTVWINPVPEPVSVKQRVHLDVEAATVDDVLARAGPLLSVMTDPEGNEFCAFETG